MSLLTVIILFILVAMGLSIANQIKEDKKTIKCPNCKYEGVGKTFVKGSILIEIILWCCFLIPGIIYSIWRSTSKYKGCPQCGFQYVVKS